MWESLLPDHFLVPLNEDTGTNTTSNRIIEHMKDISTVYSKGRGRNADREWEEDSTRKQATADEEVTSAVHLFLEEPYDKMEELSH